VGIGTLLEDGLGDTIRVSLTEEPEAEIPVARALVQRYHDRENHRAIPPVPRYPIDPFSYSRRQTREVMNFGGHQVPRVIADFSTSEKGTPASLFSVGYQYSATLDKWNISDVACDYLYLGDRVIDFEIPGTLGIIYRYDTWLTQSSVERAYPSLSA